MIEQIERDIAEAERMIADHIQSIMVALRRGADTTESEMRVRDIRRVWSSCTRSAGERRARLICRPVRPASARRQSVLASPDASHPAYRDTAPSAAASSLKRRSRNCRFITLPLLLRGSGSVETCIVSGTL